MSRAADAVPGTASENATRTESGNVTEQAVGSVPAPGTAPDTAPEPVIDQDVVIAADDTDVTEDDSSDRASSRAASTSSVAASILDYRLENGRTYHAYKDGKYSLPNDERENDRLDLQHHLFLLTFNDRLGNAPPNDPHATVGRVLDVGAGTGIWAIDFADEHPESEVLGFDLSANFPEYTPPNVRFEVDDLDEPWIYSQPFDYIHSQMMNGSISDWDVHAKKSFDNLSPGGWVEMNECNIKPECDDGTLKEDSMLLRTVQLVQEVSVKRGRPAMDMKGLKNVLLNAGFVEVRLMQYKWPTNDWPKEQRYKEIGNWSHENAVSGWEGLCMAVLTRGLGWTPTEVIVAMAQCRKELKDRTIHAYYPLYSVYGRKPTEAELAEKSYCPWENTVTLNLARWCLHLVDDLAGGDRSVRNRTAGLIASCCDVAIAGVLFLCDVGSVVYSAKSRKRSFGSPLKKAGTLLAACSSLYL
ncbi:Secondary metabolism regulator LAE1, partial [Colletotrichum shisoi]